MARRKRRCIRFKRTSGGRRCAKYAGTKKSRGLGSTRGKRCVRYKRTSAGRRCAKFS